MADLKPMHIRLRNIVLSVQYNTELYCWPYQLWIQRPLLLATSACGMGSFVWQMFCLCWPSGRDVAFHTCIPLLLPGALAAPESSNAGSGASWHFLPQAQWSWPHVCNLKGWIFEISDWISNKSGSATARDNQQLARYMTTQFICQYICIKFIDIYHKRNVFMSRYSRNSDIASAYLYVYWINSLKGRHASFN